MICELENGAQRGKKVSVADLMKQGDGIGVVIIDKTDKLNFEMHKET